MYPANLKLAVNFCSVGLIDIGRGSLSARIRHRSNLLLSLEHLEASLGSTLLRKLARIDLCNQSLALISQYRRRACRNLKNALATLEIRSLSGGLRRAISFSTTI